MPDIKIRRGSTHSMFIRVEQAQSVVFVPIEAIDNTAPVRVRAPGHGLFDSQRCAIVGAKGCTQLNAARVPPRDADYRKVAVVDVDTVAFPSINGVNFGAYLGGGVLQYNALLQLAGYEIRMQARSFEASPDVLFTASTTDGRIVLQPGGVSALLTLPDTLTSAITAQSAVFDIEFVSAGIVEFATPQHKIIFAGEITRDE